MSAHTANYEYTVRQSAKRSRVRKNRLLWHIYSFTRRPLKKGTQTF